MIFYVLNAFRPWSCDITHIDETLGKILGVSHIPLDRLHMIDNSNTGPTTDAEEFLAGSEKLRQLLTPYSAIEFSCVQQTLLQQVEGKATTPLFPLHRYLTYPWLL
ncbi:MAG: hypothetical protein LIO58_04030 [Oscillospiraceae bacterium]|nr:hypothetical protein [Oscillospiraceae bacterium]